MEWDDDGLDEGPGSPLLPPDDRLWRHPSEVVAAGPTEVRGGAAAPSSSSPSSVVTVVALTSCISVLLTLGVVAVVRPFRSTGESAAPAPTPTPTGSLATVGDVAALTALVRPVIAHVRALGAADDGGEASGSGVLYREDGLVLTAHHVVEGATSVEVVLDDGRRVGARLVGGDPETDIAVLDLDGSGFPVAKVATTSSVGDPAITIGAHGDEAGPLVRATMVSAMGQEAGVAGHRLVDMIRTNGSLAEGCVGGAVVDRRGRVIGIASSTGDGVAGFATPIGVALAVADQLVATGRVVRVWLGIEGESGDGAVVHRVKAGSPAETAGVVPGDVITALDGAPVASMSALVARLRTHAPGERVVLTVRRAGATLDVTATLAEKPATAS